MRRVLLAVDETEASARAAEFVASFFEGSDVEVTAVNVARGPIQWGAPPPYGTVMSRGYGEVWPWGYRGDDPAAVLEIAAEEEERAKAVARSQAPPDADVDMEFGDPVEAITRAAEDHDADLIVVGSHHKGFLRRLIDPSVSEQILKVAARPVLVVS